MGLSRESTGARASGADLVINKSSDSDRVIALAGNPNVGKSTVFNALTGMHQHTGNWPGKTVSNTQGRFEYRGKGYILVDLPGCYSLTANSAEEECARDFICFGGADAVVVVCDATCLERNLNLVLQIMEISKNVILCVNLMDEAKKKGIFPDLEGLSGSLGIPAVGTSARSRSGLRELKEHIEKASLRNAEPRGPAVIYSLETQRAIERLKPEVNRICRGRLDAGWLSLKILEDDRTFIALAEKRFGIDIAGDSRIKEILCKLYEEGLASPEEIRDEISMYSVRRAEEIAKRCVTYREEKRRGRDRRIDRIVTGKFTGIPIMLLILLFIFWLTVTGANYPSELLNSASLYLGDMMRAGLEHICCPPVIISLLIDGIYKTLAWVVSVMLPPMAIFFPLFTIMEDLGYLPRVAFNLDKCFKKCGACGKQALTTCMGFGCNAVGVIGCRIIDSPRERLIAIITNSFVPCNGRFPTLIAILTMFFVGFAGGLADSLLSAFFLMCLIILGVIMTFAVSKLLSKTLLKGVPSSFTLELPPYRTPQIGKVIVRSVFDRTLFVLGRAVSVAAPAGLIIWCMANISLHDVTLLEHCAGFLDPFARLLGLDGVILLAFILGFPANEIVIPIILMAYTAQGSLTDVGSLESLRALLTENGWTWVTALCTMLFSLMHWPCSTTCISIKKETGSLKWMFISMLIPTVSGMALCFIIASAARIFNLV